MLSTVRTKFAGSIRAGSAPPIGTLATGDPPADVDFAVGWCALAQALAIMARPMVALTSPALRTRTLLFMDDPSP